MSYQCGDGPIFLAALGFRQRYPSKLTRDEIDFQMQESGINSNAIAILDDMIAHVMTRPSMYGCPSDVESTLATLAALWEQFHAFDPNSTETWNKSARHWHGSWLEQIRMLHGSNRSLRLCDPRDPENEQSCECLDQVLNGMSSVFDALRGHYLSAGEQRQDLS